MASDSSLTNSLHDVRNSQPMPDAVALFPLRAALGDAQPFHGTTALPALSARLQPASTEATQPTRIEPRAPVGPHGLHLAERPATLPQVAWLWRSANLTTAAVGCGAALMLHTFDVYSLAGTVPAVIAGSATHIFPPLCALLFSAILAVHSQRRATAGAGKREALERFLLVNASFASGWTVIECALRTCGFSASVGAPLPLEALFAGVTILFYVMTLTPVTPAGARHLRDILIVGTDGAAHDVRTYLGSLPGSPFRFRGFLTTNTAARFFAGPSEDIAGRAEELAKAARSMFVDEVIVASRPSLSRMEEMCEQARSHDITLRYVPEVSEALRRPADLEYIGQLPTIVAYRRKQRQVSMATKRVMDLVLGSIALVVLSPVFAAIAIAIKLEGDGPVFYASERVGVRGRGFLCYKFRTMVPNADSLRSAVAHLNERKGVLFKITRDPRVTRLGAWLRKYSLDELPQLINVLRGEMSLVGPRPSLRAEVIQYEPEHFRRLDVIPGMTGLWQVEARCDPSFESYVALDCSYADNWSISLDMKILLRTFRIVFRGTGV